jgi:hypothetical protein
MEIVPSRRLLGLLYLAGGLILADQLADLAATLLANAPQAVTTNWRFGTYGLVISRASVFLLADVLVFAAALALEHRRVIRVLAILHLLLAPALLVALGFFALDFLQIRGQVGDAGRRAFDLAAVRAAGLGGLAAVISGWTGFVAFRASRLSKASKAARPEGAVLMSTRRDDASRLPPP